MTTLWSNTEFTRKVQTIKDTLRDKDNFYKDTILARVAVKIGASGLYNRNVEISYIDTVVSGLIVYNPEYMSYDEKIKTVDTGVQFICKACDAQTILNASELWIDYSPTTGTRYNIRSSKSGLFDVDYIFNLEIVGKQNV